MILSSFMKYWYSEISELLISETHFNFITINRRFNKNSVWLGDLRLCIFSTVKSTASYYGRTINDTTDITGHLGYRWIFP